MRAAMTALNAERGREDLIVKIGIHEGPCLAVMLNERQDYFGLLLTSPRACRACRPRRKSISPAR